MSRNANGVMSAPAGQPPAAGSVISLDDHNTLVNDLVAELTDSLSRSGKGAMTAAFKAIDGVLGGPGITFDSERTSGLFRAGAGDVRLAILGALIAKWTAAGVDVTGKVAASGNVTAGGDLGVTGDATVGGTLGVTGDATVGGTLDVTGVLTAASVDAAVGADNVDTDAIQDGAVTRAKLAAVGQQISDSSGSFSTSSGTPVDITNLSVTITTTGRPVLVFLQPDGTTGGSSIRADATAAGATATVSLVRDSTTIGHFTTVIETGTTFISVPSSSVHMIDTPSAGTHAYRAQASAAAGTTHVFNAKLVAFEL